MKIKLNFDHPHAYREWEAKPVSPRGFYRVISEFTIYVNKRPEKVRYELIIPDTDFTVA